MRIACVLIPRFALAVELLARPELRGQPVVVGGAPEDRAIVVECSPQAEREGVRHGMPLRSARAHCRTAVFIDAHPAHYRERYERMLDALQGLSPVVEEGEPGCACIGLDGLTGAADAIGSMSRAGLQPLFADEQQAAAAMVEAVEAALALRPRAGIAESRFAAWAAALSTRSRENGACVLEPGETAGFLAPLPVRYLPFPADMVRRLQWLGLRRVGDLAALPREALAAQFGPAGEHAWDLAHGLDTQPLLPREQPVELSDRVAFEQPVADVQAVLSASRYALSRLLAHPERAGRVARGLAISVALSNGHRWERLLTFHEPTGDHDRMLRALAGKLDGVEFSAAVDALTLTLRGLCGETGVQGSFFPAIGRQGRQWRELRAAIEQLRSRFGHTPVMQIVGVEPWSRIPERQYALIDCDPSTSPER